ncbi:hypothetical protein BDZ88DRAFT_313648 [Geranomyces variabilis]|nr:hypothetical protein BDZ88DRAFT_313648 [Geranomyces variabilis]KAJ3131419.1 hypothetical protein HDU90_008293 [Geranomyces variabilis]
MPMQYPLKVWQLARDVAAKGPLADPRRLGSIPHALKPHRRIIPTFMHGKKITFGDNISEKGSNRTRRAFLPNVIYHPLYSRALDMNIWCRLSTHALREVDAAGGFDEYVASPSRSRVVEECEVARMYKRKIVEALDKGGKRDAGVKEMESLVGAKYGDEYVELLRRARMPASVPVPRERAAEADAAR